MQCRRSYQPCFIGKRVKPSNGMEQKRKSSRNEEVLRKAIPGLEKKQFSWMRSIINAGGTIA